MSTEWTRWERFFASNAYRYMKGHFPCGWQGEFPKGTLIIY